MFNYDWFHGTGLQSQIDEAKRRCAVQHFADADDQPEPGTPDYQEYLAALDSRIILYLKDGLSYEMKEMANIGTSSALAFECVPVDENYTVGAYVIVVPFEDIARVEVFAVHPDDRPVENLRIPGFRSGSNEPGR
ncbi:MAG: hypothetical protein JXO22_17190 [Phycisphaerae bacterium]|nr:hypothetical protein [Phycisphaerae bacterium]